MGHTGMVLLYYTTFYYIKSMYEWMDGWRNRECVYLYLCSTNDDDGDILPYAMFH